MPLTKSEVTPTTKDKNKYTIYGKVNSKGTRYEVTKFIEADNEEIAVSIYKERLKRDFSGIRNITCIKAKQYEETDEEYSKEIELPKAKETEDDENSSKLIFNGTEIKVPKTMTSIEFGCIAFYLINLRLNNLKLYTCYYSPKKKINNSFKKNNLLFYTSFNEIDALNDIKNEVTGEGIPFKEKYIHELKVISLEDAISSSIIQAKLFDKLKSQYGTLDDAYNNLKSTISNSSNVILKEEMLNV